MFPYRFRDLETCFPGGDNVCGGLKGVTLLQGVRAFGPYPTFSSLCLLPAPDVMSAAGPPCHGGLLSLWDYKPK